MERTQQAVGTVQTEEGKMMTDYIKREDAMVAYANNEVDIRQGKFDDYRQYMRNVLRSVESVNTVPVVRCKDCRWKADTIGESWCDFHEFTILSDDDYCSYGERKDDDD